MRGGARNRDSCGAMEADCKLAETVAKDETIADDLGLLETRMRDDFKARSLTT
jgi:hypothetical protein